MQFWQVLAIAAFTGGYALVLTDTAERININTDAIIAIMERTR